MPWLTNELREILLANGRANADRENPTDFQPAVKLFCPWGGATWLLTELDPDAPDIAFGFCDLGMGLPVAPVDGAEVAALLREIYASPPEAVKLATELVRETP